MVTARGSEGTLRLPFRDRSERSLSRAHCPAALATRQGDTGIPLYEGLLVLLGHPDRDLFSAGPRPTHLPHGSLLTLRRIRDLCPRRERLSTSGLVGIRRSGRIQLSSRRAHLEDDNPVRRRRLFELRGVRRSVCVLPRNYLSNGKFRSGNSQLYCFQHLAGRGGRDLRLVFQSLLTKKQRNPEKGLALGKPLQG